MTLVLPALIIFDLECILMPFRIGKEIVRPLSKKNGQITDKNGDVIKCFPDTSAIFEKLKNSSIKIAVTAHSKELDVATQLIDMFGWNDYITYKEMHSAHPITHFKNIQKQSKVSFDKMIYFDNWIYYLQTVANLGIITVYVDFQHGLTMKLLNNVLNEYQLRKQTKNEKSEVKIA